MRRSASACTILAVVLSACGGTPRISFVPSMPGAYPAKPPACDLEVFRDAKPDRPSTPVGVIHYHLERHRTSAGALTLETALPEIKARACGAGADALVVRVTEERHLEWAMFHVAATALRFDPK